MGEKKIDFDANKEARHNLLSIINEEARLLKPFEVAWFLGYSISETYEKVPRHKPGTPVRYCPARIKALKTGDPIPGNSSLKFESKTKSVGLTKAFNKSRKVKATLCL